MICSLKSAKQKVKILHFVTDNSHSLQQQGDEAAVEDAKNKAKFYKWFPGFCKNVEYNDTNVALVNNFANNANGRHNSLPLSLSPTLLSHSPSLTL